MARVTSLKLRASKATKSLKAFEKKQNLKAKKMTSVKGDHGMMAMPMAHASLYPVGRAMFRLLKRSAKPVVKKGAEDVKATITVGNEDKTAAASIVEAGSTGTEEERVVRDDITNVNLVDSGLASTTNGITSQLDTLYLDEENGLTATEYHDLTTGKHEMTNATENEGPYVDETTHTATTGSESYITDDTTWGADATWATDAESFSYDEASYSYDPNYAADDEEGSESSMDEIEALGCDMKFVDDKTSTALDGTADTVILEENWNVLFENSSTLTMDSTSSSDDWENELANASTPVKSDYQRRKDIRKAARFARTVASQFEGKKFKALDLHGSAHYEYHSLSRDNKFFTDLDDIKEVDESMDF